MDKFVCQSHDFCLFRYFRSDSLFTGDQISRMIVGALRDCGLLSGDGSDVKGDVYVRRVLGRAVLGAPTDAESSVTLARHLHANDPWQLDAQLWQVGKTYRRKIPRCSSCYLAPCCAFALAQTDKVV
jgi:hypothetical protein